MEALIALLVLVLFLHLCTGNSVFYNVRNVMRKHDCPDSPLKGKTILFLGSSVTSGYGSHGVSFVDYLAAFHHFQAVNESVPGTTLADCAANSYVSRLNKILNTYQTEKKPKPDIFVCQLSTNDITKSCPMGALTESIDREDFDTKTTTGAIEYIIASVRETWHCPIVFYIPQQYNNRHYPELIRILYQIQGKWDIQIIDLWNNEKITKRFNRRPTFRQMDGLHPTKHGYLACYVPIFEKTLTELALEASRVKKHWWKEAVVYQIYPRSFLDTNGDGIGDLNGITEKIPYLKKLGIDVIWLSPVYQSPNADNGYDISDYQAIMKEFGTMEDFDRMLAAAHEHGIKLMMDLVVNHTSDEHHWFVESRKSKENSYRDYYIWRDGKEGQEPNKWRACFGGSAWKYDEKTDMYYLHLFAEKQPDLNWDNAKVRDEVFQMMNWWCEKGIDGFRMDVISMISKVPQLPEGQPIPGSSYTDGSAFYMNGPHVHDYIREMHEKVLAKYDLITVGEAAGVTIEEAKKYAGEDSGELNMVFQFEHVGDCDEIKSNFGKWDRDRMPLPVFKKIMSKWQTELDGTAWNSLYLSNHDQPRSVSRFGDDSPQYRVLSAKMLATCLHMMQGTPYIYQGEELGMTNAYFEDINDYRDIETLNAYQELYIQKRIPEEIVMRYLANMSRDNARTPMQWDDSIHGGFTWGIPWIKTNRNHREINARQQMNDPDSVFCYYQKLIKLRHELDVVVYGRYTLLAPDDKQLYLYTRSLGHEELLVACNFSAGEVKLPFQALDRIRPESRLLISNYKEHKKTLLQPYEAVVFLSGKH